MVYSTGVAFTVVVLGQGASLRDQDSLEEAPVEPSRVDLGAGSLKFGARDVPLTFHSWGGGENRLKIEAWAPFLPDGDLVFYVDRRADGIEHSEFRVPRSAAAGAVVLWPPELLTERRRMHDQVTPELPCSC
jgi:hypothetical protein